MSHLVPAARQLVDEVAAERPKAKAKPSGETDGFGRIRTISYDAATMKWLTPILDASADPRIAAVEDKSITFVSDVRADRKRPFGIAEAAAVLNGD